VENPSCSRLFDSNFKSLVHKFFQWRILHAQGYLIQSSSLFDSKVCLSFIWVFNSAFFLCHILYLSLLCIAS
ncbi:hypothetical protein GIB67_000579, partial [Kingdonia uniflora]